MADMSETHMNDDIVIACVDLVGRSGGSGFEIGYLHDDVPAEEAGWYAHVQFQGARISVGERWSPTGAALALAERLLSGAMCRCRHPVSLSDGAEGCRWRLVGARWEPGCDVESIHAKGQRGDYAAMQRALAEPMNRADRRKLAKEQRRG
jgi:hypothetical protein